MGASPPQKKEELIWVSSKTGWTPLPLKNFGTFGAIFRKLKPLENFRHFLCNSPNIWAKCAPKRLDLDNITHFLLKTPKMLMQKMCPKTFELLKSTFFGEKLPRLQQIHLCVHYFDWVLPVLWAGVEESSLLKLQIPQLTFCNLLGNRKEEEFLVGRRHLLSK